MIYFEVLQIHKIIYYYSEMLKVPGTWCDSLCAWLSKYNIEYKLKKVWIKAHIFVSYMRFHGLSIVKIRWDVIPHRVDFSKINSDVISIYIEVTS